MSLRLQTARLLVRTWTEADIAPYAALSADPEVMRYIGDGKPRSLAYATDFVHRMMNLYEERGWIRFAVEHMETRRFMGFCGFEETDSGVIDFGWRYSREFWGGGYGSEAAIAVLRLGLDRYHLERIESMSYAENAGSVRIMEKMGMHLLRESEENGRKVVHFGFSD